MNTTHSNISKTFIALCAFFFASFPIKAQKKEWSNIRYDIQTNAVTSTSDHAPFWLISNRHGLSSLKNNNTNLSIGLFHDFEQKENFTWAYGVEIAGAWNHVTPFYLQQLYTDIKYNCWELNIGRKRRWSEGKNRTLSGGGLTFSPNASPIPQVRFGINEYTTLTRWFNNWVQVKGHFSYGRFSDDKFMRQWIGNGLSFTQNALFHEKTGFIRIAKPYNYSYSIEIGLEMHTQFGGSVYKKIAKDTYILTTAFPTTAIEYIKAFIPMAGGKDSPTGEQTNINGNQVGSWHFATNYYTPNTKTKLYYEHFFEDHSQLLGISWAPNRDGNKQFLHYFPWSDGLYGIELNFLNNKWVRGFVAEFITSRDQSGPILHNSNSIFKEQISGGDYYYNHYLYQSWQHWGMSICNPHFLSPLYNDDHSKVMPYQRLRSYHIGIDGIPYSEWEYRILTSFTRCWGSIDRPLSTPTETTTALVEVTYTPRHWQGWQITGAVAIDYSNLIGNNYGSLFTIRKQGLLGTHL